MEVSRNLVGTERGVVLAVVLAAGIGPLTAAIRPALDPPALPASIGLLAIVALSGLSTILVGAYGGGLLAAWVAAGVPAVVLVASSAVEVPSEPTPLLATPIGTEIATVALALGLATVGFLVGRGLRLGWAARTT